jgi:hypothetical protein
MRMDFIVLLNIKWRSEAMNEDIVLLVSEMEQPLRCARNYVQAIFMAAQAMNDEEGGAINCRSYDALASIKEIKGKWDALIELSPSK